LESVIAASLRKRLEPSDMSDVGSHLHLRMLADVYQRASDFDVIHSHIDLTTLPFVESSVTPTVLTLHGRLDTTAVQRVLPMYPGVPLVSISDHQREAVEGLPVDWIATVPNGLDLGPYHRQPRGAGEYLAFVGRITGEKRPDIAVEVARRTGWPLRVAAKVDPTDVDYYHREIEPLFTSGGVEYLGEVDEAAKPSFYAGAAATLFPSDWPEPFGLVMIESLAAGTPVIALRRGAVPEVLEDGISGFICDDADGMIDAVGRLGEIDPAACRRRAEHFGVDQMCARYEAVYESVRERAVVRAPAAPSSIVS
jgi:glycosyltransferase involved in cell wall biosynthesis